MYAVIVSGGKQYQVEKGQTVKLEKLDVAEGGEVAFEQVLMLADANDIKIGTPYLSGAVVKASVVAHGRGRKIDIIKLKRRKHHMKHMGHRQYFTEVKITDIAA